MGDKCREFETSFAMKQKTKHAILFNSGASANLALLQALKNLGRLKDGDKVGFSALTWSTNVMPIIQLGMIPVPIDCSTRTLNVMSDNLLERIKEVKLQAFFGTNVLGFLGDLDKIKEICKNNNIIFLEDNCESLGSELPSGKAGNFSLGSTFSFYVSHHMSTIEGGMVCTSDDKLAEMLKLVRSNGWDRDLTQTQKEVLRKQHGIKSEYQSKYTFYDLGYNLRPTEITGFLGSFQLKFLDKNIKTRIKNYLKLEKIISGNDDLLNLSRSHITKLSTFCILVICKTPELKEIYKNKFIQAGIRPIIAGNMQKQPFHSKYVSDIYDLPGADFVHDNGFYCGNYPELTKKDLDLISSCLKK
jgi:CDP-6-deoxy-D-xylo-4-hexulose-3-dehydrase